MNNMYAKTALLALLGAFLPGCGQRSEFVSGGYLFETDSVDQDVVVAKIDWQDDRKRSLSLTKKGDSQSIKSVHIMDKEHRTSMTAFFGDNPCFLFINLDEVDKIIIKRESVKKIQEVGFVIYKGDKRPVNLENSGAFSFTDKEGNGMEIKLSKGIEAKKNKQK